MDVFMSDYARWNKYLLGLLPENNASFEES